MSDLRAIHVMTDIEVIAKNQKQAKKPVDDILDYAFIYGWGQLRFSTDRLTTGPHVFNYSQIEEEKE